MKLDSFLGADQYLLWWKDFCIDSLKNYMDTRKEDKSSLRGEPSEKKKPMRSDKPEIPEGEKQPKQEPKPGSRQNAKQDQQQNQNYLTKDDLPDATNENKGKMGSGQRQDSN